jgi:dipeptidyl aminopeptidase/acylaminoacyl peptidase
MKKVASSSYLRPEKKIDSILRADSFSIPLFNYAKTALIKRYGEDLPPISYVARPQLKLGGARFNPANYTFISNFYFKRLVYSDLANKKNREIEFPKNSILREVLWAPDGKHLAVSLERALTQEVWIVQIPSLKKKKLANVALNSVLGRTMDWVGSTKILLGVRTHAQSAPLSQEKLPPTGPIVQESAGKVSQNRTYPDLVKTPEDDAMLAAAIESQLILVDIKSGRSKKIGKSGAFGHISISPNSKWLLIDTFLRPFSRVVPLGLSAKKTEVWNFSGKVMHAFPVSGPHESLPIEGEPMGPRSIRWIQNEPEMLIYAEALDQGDWAVEAEFRDELFRLPIGKGAKPKKESLIKLKHRFAGFDAMAKRGSYFISDYERDRQWVTTFWMKDLSKKPESMKTIFSLNASDAYGDPGSPVMIRNEMNHAVIAMDLSSSDEPAIFLSGTGASPDGDHPFLRRLNLETLETSEWFRSRPGTQEHFLAFQDKTFSAFYTSYESPKESPRLNVRKPNDERVKLLYADPNPYKLLSGLKKEVITYTRADGVKLSGVLYYPLDFDASKKYPAIIRAYPLEYTDASTAGQVRGSSDKFWVPFHEDIIYSALRGYFVLDEAQMPIIGHPETKNDTFLEQLSSSAQAAVDALTRTGAVDDKKIGVIGHSYGAYMVANLLTHTDLFAAGVAKSGAYNRTLTPFGFQGERRPLWKAKGTYLKMSPFLAVDQVKAPILLIHGMADNNTGTFTMQSERYFEALKGQGVRTKLVLLPEESHGYAAIESVAHVLHEMFAWFDRYL